MQTYVAVNVRLKKGIIAIEMALIRLSCGASIREYVTGVPNIFQESIDRFRILRYETYSTYDVRFCRPLEVLQQLGFTLPIH